MSRRSGIMEGTGSGKEKETAIQARKEWNCYNSLVCVSLNLENFTNEAY